MAKKPKKSVKELAAEREEKRAEDVDVLKLRREQKNAAELRRENKALISKIELLQEEKDLLLALEDAPVEPIRIKARRHKDKNPAVFVALASDWHIEERVTLKQTNGRNEHNLEIAKEKAARYFANLVSLVKSEQHRCDIRELILWLGGDMMSGHIHRELIEITELTPAMCIPEIVSMFDQGIRFLLAELDVEKILIPTSCGNHGRDTERAQIATYAEHSYEQVAYLWLAQLFSVEPRVQFSIGTNYHNIVDVAGFRLRVHHGDGFRYQGGIAGLHVPLRKRVDRWNTHDPVDLDCFGHWHQKLDLNYAVGNGSLIGQSPYSIWIGASYEPPQQVALVIDTERKQKTSVYPIHVTNVRKSQR